MNDEQLPPPATIPTSATHPPPGSTAGAPYETPDDGSRIDDGSRTDGSVAEPDLPPTRRSRGSALLLAGVVGVTSVLGINAVANRAQSIGESSAGNIGQFPGGQPPSGFPAGGFPAGGTTGPGQGVVGVIESIDPSSMTISLGDGSTVDVEVDDSTVISAIDDGSVTVGSLAGLAIGDRVRVFGADDGSTIRADAVIAENQS